MNMALRKKFLEQYKNTGIESVVLSATPHKRVSLLYEGALRHIRQAQLAAARKDIEKKAFHTGKSMDIISGLRSVLDHEKGGDLAGQLDALYEFMLRYLLEASKENSAEKYQVVQELIETLKDGWDNMPDEYKHLDESALEKLRQQLKA
jgi:flagellar protein FliS